QLLGFAEDRKLAKSMALLDEIAERNEMDMAMVAGALACWMEAMQPGSMPLEQPEAIPVVSASAPHRDRKGGGGGRPGGKPGYKPGFKKGPKGRGGPGPKGKPPGKGGKPAGKRPPRQADAKR
ncbi:MAG: ATP-dependent helicase, partial [Marinobacter sp.]|nr:ATP-dependent helicase [Marinobacter sp.]